MPRIAIVERADMNAEQARVYDAAKQASGIVGGPYFAYIRLPKLFEACQSLRELLAEKGLADATYAAAEKTLGIESLVAVVTATGNFSMTCTTANSFGVEPPADNPTPLRA
ncbi:MAG TPA: hypothetical protein VGG01_00345 [Xanthobacteraceae bacterium]|jgi:hypothetical protein